MDELFELYGRIAGLASKIENLWKEEVNSDCDIVDDMMSEGDGKLIVSVPVNGMVEEHFLRDGELHVCLNSPDAKMCIKYNFKIPSGYVCKENVDPKLGENGKLVFEFEEEVFDKEKACLDIDELEFQMDVLKDKIVDAVEAFDDESVCKYMCELKEKKKEFDYVRDNIIHDMSCQDKCQNAEICDDVPQCPDI